LWPVEVDHHDPVPVYQQLAAIIRARIRTGELAARSPVPSEATLQQRYGVSRGTVRRAMEHLRAEGAVYTVPQRGTYVSEPPDS
jgi:GntR family transcriptional regulator